MGTSTVRALFDDHHRAIFAFLVRMTRDRAAAEDLTQEVFVRVVRNVDRYEARGRDRAWLFRIARRLLQDRWRSSSRGPALVPVDDAPLPATRATQSVATALRQSLADLPATEREAFLLREAGGLSYTEIAAVQESTPDAIRNRIYRARRALRETLPSPSAASGPRRNETEASP